jgi:hypothetical protein
MAFTATVQPKANEIIAIVSRVFRFVVALIFRSSYARKRRYFEMCSLISLMTIHRPMLKRPHFGFPPPGDPK